MAGKAILCAQCKAPLRGDVGSVTCEYCGAANMVGNPPPSTTMIRGVVHDVLNEDLNRNGIPDTLERRDTPPLNRLAAAPVAGAFRSASLLILLLAAGTLIAGGAGAYFLTVTPQATAPRLVSRPATVTSPLPLISRMQLPETSALRGIAFDGSGHVFAALGNKLLRADAATLTIDWNQTIKTPGFYDNHNVLVLADRIAVANDGGLAFYTIDDGTLTGSYQISRSGFPHFCSFDNTVVVRNLGNTTVRVDALNARNSDKKISCKSPTEMLCQKSEVCSWRPRDFKDHTCVLNLRSGDREFVPCDTDNGTGDKELVAFNLKGKMLWTSKLNGGSRPAYMTVVGETLIVHNRNLLEAFDRTTGAPRWQKTTAGEACALTPDGSRILVGNGQTLVAVDPANGQETAKLGPWLAEAEKPAEP